MEEEEATRVGKPNWQARTVLFFSSSPSSSSFSSSLIRLIHARMGVPVYVCVCV